MRTQGLLFGPQLLHEQIVWRFTNDNSRCSSSYVGICKLQIRSLSAWILYIRGPCHSRKQDDRSLIKDRQAWIAFLHGRIWTAIPFACGRKGFGHGDIITRSEMPLPH